MKHPVAKHAAFPRHPGRAVAVEVAAGVRPHHAQVRADARPAAERVAWILILITVLVVTVIAVPVALSRRSMSPGAGAPVRHDGTVVSERSSGTGVSEGTRPTSATAGADRKNSGRHGSTQVETIRLDRLAHSAKPYQTVTITGRHSGGADTLLQVQRKQQDRWVAFPVPTTTDQSGRFTTWVELGRPGRYWLRVRDPGSGATSEPFLLVITG